MRDRLEQVVEMNTNPLRRRTLLLSLVVVLAGASVRLQAQSWAERLGYPADARVLLLHADDIGMCYEANAAAKKYLDAGEIQSVAIMIPCPWASEFISWWKEQPRHDVGLHLTLTSEWRHYRWGPITPRAEVPGLVDADGYLHRRVADVARSATPEEVEKEVRAQIERAKKLGLEPSHLDTHMGTLYARPEFAEILLRVAEEYQIPALAIEMTPRLVARYRAEGYPITDDMLRRSREYSLPKLDDFHSVPGGESYEEVREAFFALVRSLEPGITEIIFHPSTETEGLRHITGSWRQRSWEAWLFSDPQVKEFFADEKLLFTDWKEMMKRWRKRGAEPPREK